MRIQEIENYFTTNDFDGLINDLQDTFDKIDGLENMFISNISDDGALCREIISQLTGYCMYLISPAKLAEAYIKNEECIFYNKTRIAILNKGGKFVSAAVDKEASEHVKDFRRIRNILDAYIDKCRTGISTCQSIIKSLTEEQKMIGHN